MGVVYGVRMARSFSRAVTRSLAGREAAGVTRGRAGFMQAGVSVDLQNLKRRLLVPLERGRVAWNERMGRDSFERRDARREEKGGGGGASSFGRDPMTATGLHFYTPLCTYQPAYPRNTAHVEDARIGNFFFFSIFSVSLR